MNASNTLKKMGIEQTGILRVAVNPLDQSVYHD